MELNISYILKKKAKTILIVKICGYYRGLCRENLILFYVNSKHADQPAQQHCICSLIIHRSRKFSQRGSNSDGAFYEGRGDPNSTDSGPSLARKLNAI